MTQQFTSSDWFDADTSQYMPQHMDPSRNSVSQHMLQPQPGADTLVEDSDDDDYVEEEEDETESDEEEEDRESALVSYGSFVEFDAWI
ncbi:hypothetical protein, partial [Escherichia coli]|uniref:hypothetical protein n=1 Tax=Escherichia coli TaxID=562 RepID=UPI00307B0D3E